MITNLVQTLALSPTLNPPQHLARCAACEADQFCEVGIALMRDWEPMGEWALQVLIDSTDDGNESETLESKIKIKVHVCKARIRNSPYINRMTNLAK